MEFETALHAVKVTQTELPSDVGTPLDEYPVVEKSAYEGTMDLQSIEDRWEELSDAGKALIKDNYTRYRTRLEELTTSARQAIRESLQAQGADEATITQQVESMDIAPFLSQAMVETQDGSTAMGLHDLKHIITCASQARFLREIDPTLPTLTPSAIAVMEDLIDMAQHGDNTPHTSFDPATICHNVANTAHFMGLGNTRVYCTTSPGVRDLRASRARVTSAVLTCALNSLQEGVTELKIGHTVDEKTTTITIADNGNGVEDTTVFHPTADHHVPPIFRPKDGSKKKGSSGKGLWHVWDTVVNELGGQAYADNRDYTKSSQRGFIVQLVIPHENYA